MELSRDQKHVYDQYINQINQLHAHINRNLDSNERMYNTIANIRQDISILLLTTPYHALPPPILAPLASSLPEPIDIITLAPPPRRSAGAQIPPAIIADILQELRSQLSNPSRTTRPSPLITPEYVFQRVITGPFSQIAPGEPDHMCAIGLHQLQSTEMVCKIIGCGHIFGRENIMRWFIANNTHCPTCRFDIRQTPATMLVVPIPPSPAIRGTPVPPVSNVSYLDNNGNTYDVSISVEPMMNLDAETGEFGFSDNDDTDDEMSTTD